MSSIKHFLIPGRQGRISCTVSGMIKCRGFHCSSVSYVQAKKYIFARRFVGFPKLEDIQLVEEKLPEIKEGEILCEAVYLSVDPYMRPYSENWKLGCTMVGGQVAKVIQSKNERFPLGTLLSAYFGWRTHTIVNPDTRTTDFMGKLTILPDLGDLSPSIGLGAIGLTGNSAYFGFLEICQPKPNDVVVVSGAAGAVGSIVGQIAKIKGCSVIGFAGTDDKVKWLVEDLGFDYAFNYKTANLKRSLKEAAPDGVDCYFDNVGGKISSIVRSHMKLYGRVSVCGAISAYNATSPTLAPSIEPILVFKQLRMEGFLVQRWVDRHEEGANQMLQWIKEGKIKAKETYTEGFENMPQAFIDMLAGSNTGKAIIKA